jgi:hypothetical protein
MSLNISNIHSLLVLPLMVLLNKTNLHQGSINPQEVLFSFQIYYVFKFFIAILHPTTIDSLSSNGVLSRTASQSFTAWTRGGSHSEEDFTAVTGEDGDPFAHVAGPTYRDIIKQGSSLQSSQQPTISDNSFCLVSAGRISLSERQKSNKRAVIESHCFSVLCNCKLAFQYYLRRSLPYECKCSTSPPRCRSSHLL